LLILRLVQAQKRRRKLPRKGAGRAKAGLVTKVLGKGVGWIAEVGD
jgi:hypothetical protein